MSGELRRQGVRIKLQEQPFQLLLALIERQREVVTREELQRRLWPPGTVVDYDRGLTKAVNRLREALGDDAENARFIETVPQRGYRFLAQTEPAPEAEPSASPPPSQPETRKAQPPIFRRRSFLAAAGGLLAIPSAYVGYRSLTARPATIRSIAVLPLENLSGDPLQEYFSDGLTDELIGEIARVNSLRVISRTSVMRYKKDFRKKLPEIARELNVDAILEGTVLRSGPKVRITAQLISAQDDGHLWSEKYESDMTDILALQDNVARAVARAVQVNLTLPGKSNPIRQGPVNADAYTLFLKGGFYLHKGLPGIAKSVEFFKDSIKLDDSFAGAYSGLAEALCYSGIFGLHPSAETYPEARRAALKALALDGSDPGAHNALADVKQGYEWDLAGAELEFQRSLQLNPSHLLSRLWYAECLTRMGRYSDAIAESGRALTIDPISAASLTNRAMLFFRARRFEEAIQAAKQALDLDPNIVNALWWQGVAYAGRGDFSSSLACLKKAEGMNNGSIFKALLGYVYGRSGDKDNARISLRQLASLSERIFVSPVDFAVVHAGMADADSTFAWLEKAYQSRAVRIHELPSLYFDSVRSDPRYDSLVRRVGLPPRPLQS